MNVQDRIVEMILPILDRFLDILTRGKWTWVHGEQRNAWAKK